MSEAHLPTGVAAAERRAARRAFWVFFAVAVVCIAQVAWWLIIQIRDTDTIASLEHQSLELEQAQYTFELSAHYSKLWRSLDSAVREPDWSGALPRRAVDDPALRQATPLPPPTRSVQTPFGQAHLGNWLWIIRGPVDSVFALLEPAYAANWLERRTSKFHFTGTPPRPGPQPWTLERPPMVIAQDVESRIDERRRSALIMFASEGSFFVLLIVLGAYLIYRSVRQSADLRRRQQNFVAAVTHELKAPLSAVKLYAETIVRPEVGREDQVAYLERMMEDIVRLEHLVDNTLMAGRLEEKGLHLKLKRTNLSRDLEQYVQGMRDRLDRKGFKLETGIEPDVEVVTDFDAMRRVVETIVENAVKYSDARNEARLTLRKHDGRVTLSVEDYGIGIPADEQERVFDAFYRVGDEMTRKIKGTGLGLYLVREIVAAHGGKVKLTSDGPGKGTRVAIDLPVAP